MRLREGIDVNSLLSDNNRGVEFEVHPENPYEGDPADFQYEDKEAYKCFTGDTIGLGDDEENVDEESEGNDASPFEILAAQMENLTEDGGVKKQVISQGVGGLPSAGAQVTVHYNAHLEFADEPYDSTILRGSPLRYILGSGEMIAGFELALESMKKKEEAKFLISPDYAYGKLGIPPRIPPNATCRFYVEMINWVECEGVDKYYSMKMSERQECDFDLIRKVVARKMEEGKEQFNQGRYGGSSTAYKKAVKALEDYHIKNEQEEHEHQALLQRMLLNVGVCMLKMSHSAAAIHYANQALYIDPNSAKARYQKGKALRQQANFTRAKEELLKAQRLEPKNPDIATELKKLESNMERSALDEKVMYQRMFKSTPEKKEKKIWKQKDSFTAPVSDDFKSFVHDRLTTFKEDRELMEVPFPCGNFTAHELKCLQDEATALDLNVVSKGEGSNMHIRILKRRPLES